MLSSSTILLPATQTRDSPSIVILPMIFVFPFLEPLTISASIRNLFWVSVVTALHFLIIFDSLLLSCNPHQVGESNVQRRKEMGNYDIFNKSYELISHCCNHISPAASLTQLTNILIVTVFRIAIIFEDCIELDDSPGYSILYHSYSIQLVTGCPTDCCYDQVKPDKCNRVARCDIPPIPHTMAVATTNNEGAVGCLK